jgi:hypothetical protein
MKVAELRYWFVPWGWLYRPIHPWGFVLTSMPAIFLVYVFRAIDLHSHSATDTLYQMFPYTSAAFLLWLWVAERTARSAPSL